MKGNEVMEEEGDIVHLDDEEMVELQSVQFTKEPHELEHDTSTVIIYLKWEPPPDDFVKINTDGFYYKYGAAPKCAEGVYGAVIRNKDDNVVVGLSCSSSKSVSPCYHEMEVI
ncbi:hypothetical protein OROMI_019832 [Orobanche minor]